VKERIKNEKKFGRKLESTSAFCGNGQKVSLTDLPEGTIPSLGFEEVPRRARGKTKTDTVMGVL